MSNSKSSNKLYPPPSHITEPIPLSLLLCVAYARTLKNGRLRKQLRMSTTTALVFAMVSKRWSKEKGVLKVWFSTLGRLASECGLSNSSVSSHISVLVRVGYFKRRYRLCTTEGSYIGKQRFKTLAGVIREQQRLKDMGHSYNYGLVLSHPSILPSYEQLINAKLLPPLPQNEEEALNSFWGPHLRGGSPPSKRLNSSITAAGGEGSDHIDDNDNHLSIPTKRDSVKDTQKTTNNKRLEGAVAVSSFSANIAALSDNVKRVAARYKETYLKRNKEFLKHLEQFSDPDLCDFIDKQLTEIQKLYVDGSPEGWVDNDFRRLGTKPDSKLSKPRYLLNDDSHGNYVTKLTPTDEYKKKLDKKHKQRMKEMEQDLILEREMGML